MPVYNRYVNTRVDGLQNVDKVKEGIKNIISHVFSKDTDVLETIQEMWVSFLLQIVSAKTIALYYKLNNFFGHTD